MGASPEVAKRTTLFADIAGSTRLYENVGDTRARSITAACIELLDEVTQRHGGRVIKTIGDEVMCVFETADDAVNAAIAMQEGVRDGTPRFGQPLKLRAGLHEGEVILEDGDVYGDAVNTAARIAGQAKADQILTTAQTIALLSAANGGRCRAIDRRTVKGKDAALEIHEIVWGDDEEVTFQAGTLTQLQAAISRDTLSATVSYQGEGVTLDSQFISVSFGRDPSNRFVVHNGASSRLHGAIELARGKILLVDRSTNGSYVRFDDGRKRLVHRDTAELSGEGVIGVGQKAERGDEHAICFAVVDRSAGNG